MPLLTTTVDDKSPLISYDVSWLPGTSQDDNYTINYYLGTHQKNNASDGTVTFNFNGSAFWIYGSNRPSHGTYTVQIDGANFPNFNGSGNFLFQQAIFNTSVSQGMHTVKLINTGGTTGHFLDLDMVVWQSEVGNTGDQLVSELVQDVDPRFQYQQTAWQAASASDNLNLNFFNNGTGHVTGTTDATVSFTFILTDLIGEAVTLFGTSGPSNGPYSAQLEGGQAVQYNASNAYPTNYGVAIYHADNLGPGVHQILLTNLPDTSGQYLTIDYAQVWAVVNTSGVISCIPPSNNIASQNSGVIAGLAVEGGFAILATAIATFFYWRWKMALNTPAVYSAFPHRSLEMTTVIATATSTALSPEIGSNTPSRRKNTFSQPLAAAGRLPQQPGNDGASSPHAASNPHDSQTVTEGDNSPSQNPNESQSSGQGPLPGALGGRLSQAVSVSGLPEGENSLPDAPPAYDTAMRSAPL